MRKWDWKTLAVVAALTAPAWFPAAWAQIVPALPFQLQNDTTADATQVMANFNQILNNTNQNAAKNGANSDITSLLGLTTPIAPGVGGTTTFTGGTSGGSANAQTVTPVVPSTFTLTAGSQVVFIAGFSNSGATTLNVSASGAKNVYRKTQVGITPMVGGEIRTGDLVTVVYDGTQYQLMNYYTVVGQIIDYTGASVPAGWATADAFCLSQATYPALFTVLSTSWGSCGVGLFALPDARGRMLAGLDGGVNRITSAGGGVDGATLAVGGGQQNRTIAITNMPAHDHGGATGSGGVDHTHVLPYVVGTGSTNFSPGGSSTPFGTVTNPVTQGASAYLHTHTITSQGGGVALETLPPVLMVRKIVKL